MKNCRNIITLSFRRMADIGASPGRCEESVRLVIYEEAAAQQSRNLARPRAVLSVRPGGAVDTMRTQIRIVAGALRGRKLVCTVSPSLRPTPQAVREALFSILGDAVPGRP